MIPDNKLVLIPKPDPFVYNDNVNFDPLFYKYRNWKTKKLETIQFNVDTKQFIITHESGEEIFPLSDPTVTVKNVSLCRDQNLQLIWSYSYEDANGNLFTAFNWYNIIIGKTVTSNFPNAKMSYVFLDEERDELAGDSDVIIFYVRVDGTLCFRLQRERFEVEYPSIKLNESDEIIAVGKTTTNRIQLIASSLEGRWTYGAMLDNKGLPILSATGDPLWLVTGYIQA